jgi:hypothetical protein
MSYTIVSAFYDIRKRENNELKNVFSNREFIIYEEYLVESISFFNKDFPLVIFCEPELESKIWEIRPIELHKKTRVIPIPYECLPYYCYFEKFKENHKNKPIWNLHKEKFTALYNYFVQLKSMFVKEVANMNPFNTEIFGWMDLRLHNRYDMDNNELSEVLSKMNP